MNDRQKIILAVFILLVTLGYGAWQWQVNNTLTADAAELQNELSTLTVSSRELATEYQDIKKDVSSARETSAQELDQVFPSDENLSDLTRLLDDFAVKTNFENNPFFISEISYQKVTAEEGARYQYVPVTLNVTTSKKNLSKFLEYVESSGSMEGQVRLMSIQDLTLNYPEEFGGTYSAEIHLNAYFAQSL